MFLRPLVTIGLLSVAGLICAAPSMVKTQSLAELLIKKKYTAPATAVAINSSQISAEISARITRIRVQIGDIVNAGATLTTLDCRSYENALDNADAQLDSLSAQAQLAEQQLKRAQSLQQKDILSEEILDQRVASLEIAMANLKGQQALTTEAKLSVGRCSITSPYRAAITSRLVGEGTMATPGLPLLEIVGLDAVELSAQVPVDLTASLNESESLTFVTDSETMPVKIRNLSPVINPESGNREVRLTTAQLLPPGTSGRLQWYSSSLLPANLLSRRNGKLGVLVAATSGGKLVARFVPLDGALEGRPAMIDLPGETMVIVEGRHKLAPDDEIGIANAGGN